MLCYVFMFLLYKLFEKCLYKKNRKYFLNAQHYSIHLITIVKIEKLNVKGKTILYFVVENNMYC